MTCEFPNVFPTELLGLSPQREIDFKIKLVPGANLSQRMVLTELKELKIQLDELL